MFLDNTSWFDSNYSLLITGESNVGKTTFLKQIIAEAILPERFKGRDADVIFLDTKTNLKMHQLEPIVQNQIRRETLTTPEVQIQALAKSMLSKLTIYRVYSWNQLEQMKIRLKSLLEVGDSRKIVILDSLGTFYWSYCATITKSTRLQFLKRTFDEVSEVCRRFSVPFATTCLLDQTTTLDTNTTLRMHLEKMAIQTKQTVFKAHLNQGKSTKIRNYGIRDSGPYWLK